MNEIVDDLTDVKQKIESIFQYCDVTPDAEITAMSIAVLLTGMPDVLDEVIALLHSQQAKIDWLMLEYCPDEMTQEQKENWAAHQKPAHEEG